MEDACCSPRLEERSVDSPTWTSVRVVVKRRQHSQRAAVYESMCVRLGCFNSNGLRAGVSELRHKYIRRRSSPLFLSPLPFYEGTCMHSLTQAHANPSSDRDGVSDYFQELREGPTFDSSCSNSSNTRREKERERKVGGGEGKKMSSCCCCFSCSFSLLLQLLSKCCNCCCLCTSRAAVCLGGTYKDFRIECKNTVARSQPRACRCCSCCSRVRVRAPQSAAAAALACTHTLAHLSSHLLLTAAAAVAADLSLG